MSNHCEHCADLQRRVAALEEMVFRTHRARKIILQTIEAWPGPFTAQQIETAIKEFHPEVFSGLKPYAVTNQITRLEKTSAVVRENTGRGQIATIFRTVGKIAEASRPGPKYGRRANYESGFRNIVRSALRDLPEPFMLQDLRDWMKQNLPGVEIPYGSWSSTLYKLQQQGELVCLARKGKNTSCNRKIYGRGPVRVTPTGDEMKEMEQAWREFRDGMKIEVPELEMSKSAREEA